MTTAEFGALIKRNPLRVISTVMVVAAGFGIYYMSDVLDAATQSLGQKTTEADRLAANVSFSAQLPEQLQAITAASTAIQARAVRASQLANNLQYFYRLETESGVQLIDLRQTTGASALPASKGVGFSISVKGEYSVLLGWLRRMESGPHFCRLMTATIGISGIDRSTQPTLTVAVELWGQP